MNKLRNYLCSSIGFYTALFVALWLTAWIYNGYYATKFNLDSLKDIYVWLMTQLNVTHGINSVLNSNRGEMP